jgi:hypothetical protein
MILQEPVCTRDIGLALAHQHLRFVFFGADDLFDAFLVIADDVGFVQK